MLKNTLKLLIIITIAFILLVFYSIPIRTMSLIKNEILL
jgi:hypothetical protein